MSNSDERPPILRLTWSMVGAFLFIEILFAAGVIGLTFFLCVRSHGQAAEPDAADRAVRALLAKQVQDWNKGELEQFMEGYWKDDALTFFSGATMNPMPPPDIPPNIQNPQKASPSSRRACSRSSSV